MPTPGFNLPNDFELAAPSSYLEKGNRPAEVEKVLPDGIRVARTGPPSGAKPGGKSRRGDTHTRCLVAGYINPFIIV